MEDSQNTQQPANNEQQFQAPPKEKSGKGKKVALVILILILIAGAGFAGYAYAKNQAQKETDSKVAELQKQIDEAKAEASEKIAAAESEDGGYLEIKEWSVKIEPTESAMFYKISKSGENEITYLTNTKVQSLDGCKATETLQQNGYLATLSRSRTKLTDTANIVYITQIGDYYYYVTGSQASCAKSDADQKVEMEQLTALTEAAKTVMIAE